MTDPIKAKIQVHLDYAPKENGKEFDEWCEKHGFNPLNSGRRAWCSQFSTYLRGAAGVATTVVGGESFIFYEQEVSKL